MFRNVKVYMIARHTNWNQSVNYVRLKGDILRHWLTKYWAKITSRLCEIWFTLKSYLMAILCQNISQCRSLYDCQTHKLLRPSGWLGLFERKYSLQLCGEVFLKNNEPFFRKMHYNSFMLSRFCSWYMIAQVCLLILMFPATPKAQSAAAKWLTRFYWKGIFSFIRWRSIRQK